MSAALAAWCGLAANPALAQSSSYPNKPIRLVVPFPAGGGTDILGRLWGRKMSEILKQPIIIDNLGGAAGTVGSASVARATADGYTLVLGVSASHAIAPSLYSDLRYDPVRDFVPIGQIATFGNAVIVHPSTSIRNIADLVVAAKREPAGLSYGTWGIGSAGHLAMEMVKMHTGAALVHIPYKGASPTINDVMANQIAVGVGGVIEVEAGAKANRLRVVAVTGTKRAPNFPDVPTMAEQGIPFSTDSWYAVFAPAKTPADVLAKLRDAFVRVRTEPGFRAELWAIGMNVSELNPEQFGAVQRSDVESWAKLVKVSGAQAN